MHLEKPIKLKKSFELETVKMVGMDGPDSLPTLHLSGYASRGFSDNGMRAIDLDGETINQYGIDVSRLETKNIPLLFQHDQSKIVGKVLSASYDTKGLFVTAELTKLPGDSLTNYVYEAVKAGMLNSFSVGLMVEEVDMVDQGEEAFLEISKSHLFELSVVSAPALSLATFSTQVIKSADHETTARTIISRSALQEDNDNLCDTLGCLLKKGKTMSKKEVKKEVEPEVTPEVEPDATPAEPEAVPEATPVEPEATPAPEPAPAVDPEPAAVVKPKEEEAPSKTSIEQDHIVTETPSNIEEEAKVSEPEAVTIDTAIEFLSGINVSTLDEDDLENVYEIISTLTEAIEKKVVEEAAQEYLSQTKESNEGV